MNSKAEQKDQMTGASVRCGWTWRTVGGLTAALALAAGLTACAEGVDGTDETEPVVEEEASSASEYEGLAVASALPRVSKSLSGCRADVDCAVGTHCDHGTCAIECHDDSECLPREVCTSRGRCVPGPAGQGSDEHTGSSPGASEGSESSVGEASDGLLIAFAAPRLELQPRRGVLELPLLIEGELPAEGVRYRLERSDVPPGLGPDMLMRLLPGQTVVSVPFDGAAVTEPIRFTLSWTGGRFATTVIPAQGAEGLWVGGFAPTGFGAAQLPASMRVRTVPAGATFGAAQTVLVELPIQGDTFLAPERPRAAAALQWSARELVEEEPGLWVARFENAWPIPGGALPAVAAREAVHRSIRVELRPGESDRIEGRVVDRWRGLLARQHADGGLVSDVVEFSGTLSLFRIDAPVPATPVVAGADSPLPVPRFPLPPAIACADSDVWLSWPDAEQMPGGLSEWEALPPQQRNLGTLSLAERVLAQEALAPRVEDAIGGSLGADVAALVDECLLHPEACVESPRIRCARQLVARAVAMDRTAPEAGLLGEQYARLMQEATVGRQLRAFGADQRMRLQWLEQSEFTGVLANRIRGDVLQSLDGWMTEVLEVHASVLRDHLDTSSMAMLVALPDATAREGQQHLARDAQQAWHAVVASLDTAARWYHRVLQDSDGREHMAQHLRGHLGDLYRTAGLLRVAQGRLGLDGWGAGLGSGFGAAAAAIDVLSQPEAALLWARDGEVVAQTALGAGTGDVSMLSVLETEAVQATERASTRVREVHNEVEVVAFREAELRTRMEQEVRQLRQQLVQACGVPEGCTVARALAGQCALPILDGTCGFLVRDGEVVGLQNGGSQGSDAGQAIARVLDAILGVASAEEELDALMRSADLSLAEMRAHAEDIVYMRTLLDAGVTATRDAFAEIRHLRSEATEETRASLLAQLDVRLAGMAERDALESEIENVCLENLSVQRNLNTELMRNREAYIRAQRDEVSRWFNVTVDGIDTSYEQLLREAADLRVIRRLEREAGHGVCGKARFGGPEVIDAGLQTLGLAQQGAQMGGWYGAVAGAGVGILRTVFGRNRERRDVRDCESDLDRVDRETQRHDEMSTLREREERLRQAELTLARDMAGVERAVESAREAELREIAALEREMNHCRIGVLQRAVQRSRDREAFRIAELQMEWQVSQSERQGAIQTLQEELQVEQAILNTELALQNELRQLRARQVQWQQTMLQVAGIELRIARAEHAVERAMEEYLAIELRAQMTADQLAWTEVQHSRVEELLGSPAVLFARAGRVAAAEASVDEARARLMDWLLALEYEAVRPFVEQRAALLLARSPGQLEAVAAQLRQLRTRCGGPVSRQSVSVSLRHDVTGLVAPQEDLVSRTLVTPAERFRRWMAAADVPMTHRVRMAIEASLGADHGIGRGTWAGVVALDLGDFANLAGSCNARIEAIGVELVGDLGYARPSVTVVHDGTARVRSCQPDLDGLLRAQGATRSAYGGVSHLRTEGRSATVVAGLNEAPESPVRNRGLSGLPLASRYTVLIQTDRGENAALDWTRLDDIVLHIDYTHQDPFAPGQCG